MRCNSSFLTVSHLQLHAFRSRTYMLVSTSAFSSSSGMVEVAFLILFEGRGFPGQSTHGRSLLALSSSSSGFVVTSHQALWCLPHTRQHNLAPVAVQSEVVQVEQGKRIGKTGVGDRAGWDTVRKWLRSVFSGRSVTTSRLGQVWVVVFRSKTISFLSYYLLFSDLGSQPLRSHSERIRAKNTRTE